MTRLHGYALSAVVIAATAYPAFLAPHEDDFPLSTYPMFSSDRGRTAPVISALAVGDDFERPVPPHYVANAEAMQALQTLNKSVRAGRRSARALCKAIAARMVDAGEAELAGATEIALVTRRVDSVAYLGGAGPEAELSRHVHARCPAPGRAVRPGADRR